MTIVCGFREKHSKIAASLENDLQKLLLWNWPRKSREPLLLPVQKNGLKKEWVCPETTSLKSNHWSSQGPNASTKRTRQDEGSFDAFQDMFFDQGSFVVCFGLKAFGFILWKFQVLRRDYLWCCNDIWKLVGGIDMLCPVQSLQDPSASATDCWKVCHS